MKRKSVKKLMAMLLLSAMVLGSAACGAKQEPAKEETQEPAKEETGESAKEEAQPDAGETAKEELPYVELKLYAIADAPNNTDLAKQYWEELNATLKEELNCTIDYTYAAGNDYKNNYALAIASGEKYDLIQAAPGWLDYQSYAAKNAFMPLDDLLPEYAPYLWETIPRSTWDAASVNGKIYAVPGLDTGVTACTFV